MIKFIIFMMLLMVLLAVLGIRPYMITVSINKNYQDCLLKPNCWKFECECYDPKTSCNQPMIYNKNPNYKKCEDNG